MGLPRVAIGLAGKRLALTTKQGQALGRGLGARPTQDPPGSECACLGPQGCTRSQREDFIWEVTPGGRGEGRAGKAAGIGGREAVAPLGARDVDGAGVAPASSSPWPRAAGGGLLPQMPGPTAEGALGHTTGAGCSEAAEWPVGWRAEQEGHTAPARPPHQPEPTATS